MKKSIALCLFLLTFSNENMRSQSQTSATSPTNAVKINPLEPDYVAAPVAKWESRFHDFGFKTYEKDGHVLPFRIYRPAHLEAGKKYPLVMFFHGAGERGLDNRLQLFRFGTVTNFWEKYPCFVIAPQCPPRTGDHDGQSTWVQTGFGDPSHVMKKQPTWPMALAMNLLDETLAENQIDTGRVYVTGLSMGGFATWEILQRKPGTFAAAMPVCGGGDPAFARESSKIPIWIFHGSADDIVQPKRSRDMAAALIAAGGHPIYTEYIGAGHDVWGQTYSDMKVWDWLFTHAKE